MDQPRVAIQIRNMNRLSAEKLVYDLRNVLERHGFECGINLLGEGK